MENRAIKIVRWILLAPLTLAVPTLVMFFVNVVPHYFSAHELLHSIWWLALVAQLFIPGFLIIPTACAIAPSHHKKVSTITLVSVACLWFAYAVVMSLLQPPIGDDVVFSIIALCAPLLGLATGFAVVRFALKKRERGEPFLRRSVIIVIAVVCITAIPLYFFGNRDGSVDLRDLAWYEHDGVVWCSFTLENKSNYDNAVTVELIAVRGYAHNQGYPAYTPEILAAARKSTEKTSVNMFLPPKNIQQGIEQLTLDANAKGSFTLVARLIYRTE